jgi:hypothetical protein
MSIKMRAECTFVRYANKIILAYLIFLFFSGLMTEQLDSDAHAALWGAFWRDAEIDGCIQAFPALVRSAIDARWQAFFADAAGDGTVLDLCCGRGAVLAHAARAGRTLLTGIEKAVVPLGRFDIRCGIDAAALPFADRSFALVTSQFGVEYAGLATAGAEAARVADKAVLMLLHAAEGPVVSHGRVQIAQVDWLLDGIDAFGRMRRHSSAPSPDTLVDIEALRAAIVREAETAENTALLEAVWQAVPAILAMPKPIAAVQRLANDLADHAERLAAMVAAAPSRQATEALAAQLRDAGFAVLVEDLGSSAAARWVVARRH